MRSRNFMASLTSVALILSLCAVSFADTIHLRDGSVIRGQVVGFKDQQFTVLVGQGTRGRRSRVTLYMEDVDSIEFDNNGTGISTVAGNADETNANDSSSSVQTPPASTRPPFNPSTSTNTTGNRTSAPANSGAPVFFPIRLRVRADNASNGWNDSGLMVRRGQRLRITATGRVSLGGGIYSTPTGLPRQPDNDKLMRNEPTGALIAVIGDDNDDFIFVGSNREFVAQRDGRLFLGVNEGNLSDNSGAYDVTVEAEALSGAPR